MIEFRPAVNRLTTYSAYEKPASYVTGTLVVAGSALTGRVIDVTYAPQFVASSFEDYSSNWRDFSFGFLAED